MSDPDSDLKQPDGGHPSAADPVGPPSSEADGIDFQILIVRYLDGQLDAAAVARFNADLRSDPDKQNRFVEFCVIRAGMIELLKEEAEYDRTTAADPFSDSDFAGRSALDLSETMVSPALVEPPEDVFESGPTVFQPAVSLPAKKRFYRWWSAAAVFLAALGTGILVRSVLGPTSRPPPLKQPVAVDASGAPSGSPASGDAPDLPAGETLPASTSSPVSPTTAPVVAEFARLVQSIDARWGAGAVPESQIGHTLAPGRHELLSGVVRIELPATDSANDRTGGASLVIQGPATFEIDSPAVVRLSSGKLSAKVPHNGASLSVVTPDLTAVDLGTEFGLEVTPGGRSFLNVFDGRVRADVQETGNEVSTRVVSSRVLSADEAVVVDSGSKEIRTAVPQPLAFVRSAEMTALAKADATPLQRWTGFSKSLRLDPDLVAYYPFDNKDEAPNRLVNRAVATAGRHDAVFSGRDPDGTVAPVWSTGRWPGKLALTFGQTGVSSVNFTDVQDLIPDKAITICVWLKRSETARPVHFLHGTVGRTGQFNIELMGTDAKSSVNLDPRRSYFSWADKDVPSGEILPAGTDWYFLCITSSVGGTTDFYVNGEKVSSARNSVAVPTELQKLTLGAPVDGSDADYRDYFRGSVDELMVFKRILSGSEIRRLYCAGGTF